MKRYIKSIFDNQNHKIKLIFLLIFILFISVKAQENGHLQFKRWILGTEGMWGVGFDNYCLGYYQEYNAITGSPIGEPEPYSLSTGGGLGYSLLAGYRFTSRMECLVHLGKQKPGLSKHISNVDGDFYRSMYSLTLKFKVPMKITDMDLSPGFVFGGGGGLYTGRMVLYNAFESDEGNHYRFQYKTTIGYHAIGGLEMVARSFSIVLIARLHLMRYELKSLSIDSSEMDIRNVVDDFRNVNANGCDMSLGFNIYL